MYQDYMAKSLTDKYASLSSQMDGVINDANAEITSLRDKLSGEFFDLLALHTKHWTRLHWGRLTFCHNRHPH